MGALFDGLTDYPKTVLVRWDHEDGITSGSALVHTWGQTPEAYLANACRKQIEILAAYMQDPYLVDGLILHADIAFDGHIIPSWTPGEPDAGDEGDEFQADVCGDDPFDDGDFEGVIDKNGYYYPENDPTLNS